MDGGSNFWGPRRSWEPEPEKITLEAEKAGATRMISDHELERLPLGAEAHVMREMDGLRVALSAYVHKHRLGPNTVTAAKTITVDKVVDVRVPDGPLQWWKMRNSRSRDWGTRWFIRRFPVKMLTKRERVTADVDVSMSVTWEQAYTFPDSTIYPPELGKPFQVLTHGPADWRTT